MMLWWMVACVAPSNDAPDFIEGPTTNADVGALAPDFTLEGAGGVAVTLSDDLGKVIFLDMSGFT